MSSRTLRLSSIEASTACFSSLEVTSPIQAPPVTTGRCRTSFFFITVSASLTPASGPMVTTSVVIQFATFMESTYTR